MSKTPEITISDNNIRTLIYFFGIQLDRKLDQLLEKSPYKKIRASDGRVFISATRGIKTISDIGRHLHISRQSTQSSVSRLVKFGLLKLDEHPASKRERLIVVTDQGQKASVFAIEQLHMIEHELAQAIGDENYATLRKGLESLVQTAAMNPAALA